MTKKRKSAEICSSNKATWGSTFLGTDSAFQGLSDCFSHDPQGSSYIPSQHQNLTLFVLCWISRHAKCKSDEVIGVCPKFSDKSL